MKRSEFPTIFANIAASYARRELDRSFYDRLMTSPLGVRLAGLDRKNKFALEFVAYSITAITLEQNVDVGSVRTFVNSVVADVPTEIAKRVINGSPEIYPDQVKDFLANMSDDEILALIEDVRTIQATDETSIGNQSVSENDSPSALSVLAKKIEGSRQRIRERTEKRTERREK